MLIARKRGSWGSAKRDIGAESRKHAIVRIVAIASLVAAAALAAAGIALAAYQLQTGWGAPGNAAGQFNNAGLIAVGPDGSVYVPDTGNNRVQKFTADGAFLLTFGSAGAGNGAFDAPSAAAVGPDGNVYVVDAGNSRIEVFDANGTFVTSWGSPGALAGQFTNPTGIAVGLDGSVYVADRGNNRVERFQSDGTFVSAFTSGAGGFVQIEGIAVGSDGSVYVVDFGAARVEHFSSSDTFLGTWGTNGSGDGQFQGPVGVAASASGVYVADSSQNRVQKFTPAGAYVDSLDAGAGDPQFGAPSSVAISSLGSIYVLGGSHIGSYSETGGANLPPPTTGETANAEPTSGTVKVRRPGSNQFTTLTEGQQIPIGSIIDVRKGTIDLTTTAAAGQTQTARFYSGIFKLAQTRSANPVTELQLFGGNFRKACSVGRGHKAAMARSRSKRRVRQLWGNGKGNFRTKGKYASAAIRGTQWLTQDRCDGTLVRVKQGSVAVRDFARRKTVTVTAPRSYLAHPRAR